MSEEINSHFMGRAAVFCRKSDDAESEGVTPVEITEVEGDLVEIAFDTHDTRKRTYLRFNRSDMARAVKAFGA